MRNLIFASLFLAACSSTPLSPHKIDIQQGNFVNQEMIAKLQPGMTRPQVRFILGTPLVSDPFHADRWDYVYRYQKGGEMVEQRRITVLFRDDKLEKVEGDVVPSGGLTAEAAGADARSAGTGPRSRPAATRESAAAAGKPPIPGDVGDTQSAEAALPKAKPAQVKVQPKAAKQEKGLTSRLFGFLGFGKDNADEAQAEAPPPQPTVERTGGGGGLPVAKASAANTVETKTTSADRAETKNANANSAETKSAANRIEEKSAASRIEEQNVASRIEDDERLRNREGKTIADQLRDKFGFSSSSDDEKEAQSQTGQAAGSEGKTDKGDGQWRNREGKTIMEQVREKFGFGSSDEPKAASAESPAPNKQPEKTDAGKPETEKPETAKTETGKTETAKTARAKEDEGFVLRNREGKTIWEQVREKFWFSSDEPPPAGAEAATAPREAGKNDAAKTEPEKIDVGKPETEKPETAKTETAKTARAKEDEGFVLRNREGKTIWEQVREKFSFGRVEDSPKEKGGAEAASKSAGPAASTGGGTISADNPDQKR